jgi:hypothetical protein
LKRCAWCFFTACLDHVLPRPCVGLCIMLQVIGFSADTCKVQLQWFGYTRSSFEPLHSLVAGPDTYSWVSKESWLDFCRQGPGHIKPILYSTAAPPAHAARGPDAGGRPAQATRARSMPAPTSDREQPPPRPEHRAPKRSRQGPSSSEALHGSPGLHSVDLAGVAWPAAQV